MDYIITYLLIGLGTSLMYDLINKVLRPEDRVYFDWGLRTINIIIWPYILWIFITTLFK